MHVDDGDDGVLAGCGCDDVVTVGGDEVCGVRVGGF